MRPTLRILAATALLTVLTPAAAQPPVGPVRIGNSGDPVLVSVAISQATFPSDGSAQGVILARNDTFVDALAGAPLAGHTRSIIYPDPAPQPLRQEIIDEIQRAVGPPGGCQSAPPNGFEVAILGGLAAISQAVQDTIDALGYCVQRFAGDSREQTAIAIADAVVADGPVERVLIARRDSFADAATGGVVAAALGLPLLVTPSHVLHPDVAGWLDSHEVGEAVLLGGTAAIADATAADIGSRTQTTTRVAGPSRDATAVQIATQLLPDADPTSAVLVNGYRDDSWVWAIAGAPLAAVRDLAMLYIQRDGPTPATVAYVEEGRPPGETIDVVLLANEADAIIPPELYDRAFAGDLAVTVGLALSDEGGVANPEEGPGDGVANPEEGPGGGETIGGFRQTNVLSQNAVGYVRVTTSFDDDFLIRNDFEMIDGEPTNMASLGGELWAFAANRDQRASLFVWDLVGQTFRTAPLPGPATGSQLFTLAVGPGYIAIDACEDNFNGCEVFAYPYPPIGLDGDLVLGEPVRISLGTDTFLASAPPFVRPTDAFLVNAVDGRLGRVNPTAPDVVFDLPTTGSSALQVPGGPIVTLSTDGLTMSVFDASGQLIQEIRVTASGPPVTSANGARVVVPQQDGYRVYDVDSATGMLSGEFSTGTVQGPVSIAGDGSLVSGRNADGRLEHRRVEPGAGFFLESGPEPGFSAVETRPYAWP